MTLFVESSLVGDEGNPVVLLLLLLLLLLLCMALSEGETRCQLSSSCEATCEATGTVLSIDVRCVVAPYAPFPEALLELNLETNAA